MSIGQFLRIIWARRWWILATTFSCLVGAYLVTMILPPRWDGVSRVMLNLLKPDPVTGEVIAGPNERAYVATQEELITDYTVAGRVADQLGWLSDPGLIAQWQARPRSDQRDFRRWLAQLVIDRTKAKVVEGSNILEITYSGASADQSRAVADALRTAYIGASLEFRREDATRNADWYDEQTQKAKDALNAAQTKETEFERANGLVMADDKTDTETARLRALAQQGGAGAAAPPPQTVTAASLQLSQIDATIAQEAQILGPNHPELQRLRAQRAQIAGLVAKEQSSAATAAAAAASGGALAIDRAVEAQKSRVIAEGEKLQELSELQADVALRRDLFDKTSAKAAEFRQEAAAADTGITPLGVAVTPKAPTFPNMLLIIPGSIVLGLGTGVLVALLAELFARRVRSPEDLQSAIDMPLLAVITGPGAAQARTIGVRAGGARSVGVLDGKAAGA